MWGGMDVAFSQYVSSITVPPTGPSAATHSSSATSAGAATNMYSSSSSSSSVSMKNKVQSTAHNSDLSASNGDFFLLSDVTRKLIVTPTHLIGQSNTP